MNIKLIALILLFSSFTFANQPIPNSYLLVGKSSFSVLFWDVYDIQLKTPSGIYQSGEAPLILELTYKREISKEDLVAETLKQWKRFELDKKQKQQWAEDLLNIWPNVNEGDEIAFHIDEKRYTQFYYNSKLIGVIPDPLFSEAFSAIWLDADGPYPKMTKQLIGLLGSRE